MARELAERGWHLTLVARRGDVLEQVGATIAPKGGYTVITCDLADASSRDALIERAKSEGREVAVLLNNAGFSTTGPIGDAKADRELAMLRTNVEAVVHLCSVYIPQMIERRSGAVLNVASTAAFQPIPGQAGYGATKAFVLSYTQAIRAEAAGTGVHITTLCPGPVETGFAEAAGMTDDEAGEALPKIMWVPSETVAKKAIEGLIANKMVVIPGIANRATTVVAGLLPRSGLLPIMAKVHPALKK
jgi:short-subunit dehydrogenase